MRRTRATPQGGRHPPQNATRELRVSQCLYAMPRVSDSISVDLIRGETRAFWARHFANVRDAELASA